ncbi:MAG: helix-turn-helix transcriptional regulator [Bacteroidales bacterium]|jgi:DNA-binding NarL/FixJ family response regulator|nr:helix-turn-helix transcriptional regulator [Bacteroidales bacterium]
MNNQLRHRILLIEPSQIIATGLANMIGRHRIFETPTILSDVDKYYTINRDTYDVMIVNPSVFNFRQRFDIRHMLSIDNNTALLIISYGINDENMLYQYDGCISIYDSAEMIEKKLLTAVDSLNGTPKSESDELSGREREILAAVAKGKTNKEIAGIFNLSVYTVVTHRKNISRKLGINSIAGLTVYAMINKLIDVKDYSRNTAEND